MATGHVNGFVLDGDAFTKAEAERGFSLVSVLLGTSRGGPWRAAGFPGFPAWIADAVLPDGKAGSVYMEYSEADALLGYIVAERAAE